VLIASGLVVGLIVGAVAAYAVHQGTPTYQSQALLEIDQAHALANSPDDGVVAKLSRLRYKYAGLIRTQVFATPVASGLGLPPGAVVGALYAGVDPNSLLLAIGARSSDRARAESIAGAAAQGLVDYARSEQTAAQIPAALQVTFSIVTPAGPAAKVSPTRRRVELVGLGAFLFVAAGTVGFGYLWRRDS
jgi:capsular polysaccharide biosynthesis protein